jgi:hypothetical protein
MSIFKITSQHARHITVYVCSSSFFSNFRIDIRCKMRVSELVWVCSYLAKLIIFFEVFFLKPEKLRTY